MARVIGASPVVNFETLDMFDARWQFNRSFYHSYVAASPAGENGQRVHIFTINLGPSPLTQFTAYYSSPEARDQALVRLMSAMDIEDPMTAAKLGPQVTL